MPKTSCRMRGCVTSGAASRSVRQAYLTTIVTRLCLDRLKSARATREEYVGPWLPEPVLTDEVEEPGTIAGARRVGDARFMVLLETLSPEERAVFLLREVFDHEYDEIAAMLEHDAGELPSAVSPRKARIAERRPRLPRPPRRSDRWSSRFVSALRDGDGDGADSVLAEDVGFWSDGGGKVLAARRPIFGRDHVVQVLVGIRRTAPSVGIALDATSRWTWSK